MRGANRTFKPLGTLTVREAAALLHVSRPTVEKYIKAGELPERSQVSLLELPGDYR